MNVRLQQFLIAENLTQSQFAESINVAPAAVSHAIAGRNKPGYDFIYSTMKRYPKLNIEWLIMGKGKMYKDAPAREQPADSTTAKAVQADQAELFHIEETGNTDEINIFDSVAQDKPITLSAPDNASSSGLSTTDTPVQITVKQRKAVKIIVFFDDGTFQEF